jgi:hypothetical protein
MTWPSLLYFNFIGATEAELDPALSELLFPVLQNEHQVSLPITRPDHYFEPRFMSFITTCMINLGENHLMCILLL